MSMYNDPDQLQQPYEAAATQHAPPFGQSPYAAPPPPRQSRRGIWIALAIVGAVLVLSCGGCVAAAIAGVGFFARTLAAPSAAASGYYRAIENQQYDVAYSYLDTNSLNLQEQQINAQTFTVAAEARYEADGKVTGFTQTTINVNTTNGVSTAAVTLSVTRGKQTYLVHLQMQEENNVWKITDFDTI
jgi:hypothetical protein